MDNTQRAVNAMIGERDGGNSGFGCCITCGEYRKLESGHFRGEWMGTTTYHPWNLNGQRVQDNSGSMSYEYGVALDKKFGGAPLHYRTTV
jgi:hypothetical protein